MEKDGNLSVTDHTWVKTWEYRALQDRFRHEFRAGPIGAGRVLRTSRDYLLLTGSNHKIQLSDYSELRSFNNDVYKFTEPNKNPVVVKAFSGDRQDIKAKLAVEVGALAFIEKSSVFPANGDVLLPKKLLVSKNNFSVVSEFINGLKGGNRDSLVDVPKSDKLIISFLNQLNQLKFVDFSREFVHTSRYYSPSAYNVYQEAVRKCEDFKTWLQSNAKTYPTMYAWCANKKFFSSIDNFFNKAVSEVDTAFLHRKIEPDDLRFNWGDVGFNNLYFRQHNQKTQIVPFDLEYAGWDHFSSGVVSLLLHHQSEEVDTKKKKDILDNFVRESRLTEGQVMELNTRLVVGELLFLSRKLTAASRPLRFSPQIVRHGHETIDELKIDSLLLPALARAKQEFLQAN